MYFHEKINRLFTGRDKEHPEEWDLAPQTGMPKTTGVLTATDYRWLTITDHMNQWYNRSWREQFRERPLVTKVHTWGFCKEVGPEPVQDIARAAIRKAFIWDTHC